MKKEYIEPKITAASLDNESLLAGSIKTLSSDIDARLNNLVIDEEGEHLVENKEDVW